MYQGFDEYMNIVLDDAAEVNVKTKESKPIGTYIYVSYFIFLMLSFCNRTYYVERRLHYADAASRPRGGLVELIRGSHAPIT